MSANSFDKFKFSQAEILSKEIEKITEEKEIILENISTLPSLPLVEDNTYFDQFSSLQRRILIAAVSFGIHNYRMIANFVDLPLPQIKELSEDDKSWLNLALLQINERGEIPCFNKAEIIARLCCEADASPSPKDRINALTKLMEFRGMTAPEGSAKSFQRIAMRFRRKE